MSPHYPPWLRPLTAGAGTPPPLPEVRSTRSVNGLFCTILESTVHQANLHYDREQRRFQPCTGDPLGCYYCLKRVGWMPKGFVCAEDGHTRQIFVLEISDLATRDLLALGADQGCIRGLKVRVYRTRGGVPAPLRVELVGVCEDIDGLPLPCDTPAVLLSRWRVLPAAAREGGTT